MIRTGAEPGFHVNVLEKPSTRVSPAKSRMLPAPKVRGRDVLTAQVEHGRIGPVAAVA